jgi:hypothetical protein
MRRKKQPQTHPWCVANARHWAEWRERQAAKQGKQAEGQGQLEEHQPADYQDGRDMNRLCATLPPEVTP